MDEQEIKKVYDSFVLPEEDREMIYEHIIKEKRRKQPMSKWMKAAVIAGCLLVGGSSVYAAVNLLKPSEVAENFEDKKLAGKFAALSDHIVTKENEKYRVSYLGEVSGKNMSDIMESDQSRTYYVVALERKGGEELTEYDDLTATPFVKGFAPWKYNIWWMGGGSTYDTIDGVRYYLFSCDDVEIFADKGVYLGICDDAPNADMYTFDEKTGEIGRKEAYKGTNLLFELDIDPAKADLKEQEKVLKQLQKQQGLFYDMDHSKDSDEDDDVGFVDPETGENPAKASHYTADEFMALSEKEQHSYLEKYGTLVSGSSKDIQVDQDGTFSYEWKGGKGKDIIDIKEKNDIKTIDCKKKAGKGNVIGCFGTDDAFYIEVAYLKPDDENTVTCALYRVKTE